MAKRKDSDKSNQNVFYWDKWSLGEKLEYFKKHKRSKKKIEQTLSDCANANLIGRVFTSFTHPNGSLDLTVEITVNGKKEWHDFEKVSPIPKNIQMKMVSNEIVKEPSLTSNRKKSILKKPIGEEDWVETKTGVSILKEFQNLHEQNMEASQVGGFVKLDKLIDEAKGLDVSNLTSESEQVQWLWYERIQEKLKVNDMGAVYSILCQFVPSLSFYRDDLIGAIEQIKDMPEIQKNRPASRSFQLFLDSENKKVS